MPTPIKEQKLQVGRETTGGKEKGKEVNKNKMKQFAVATTCGREIDFSGKEPDDEAVPGVFFDLVNTTAFIDKLTMGVDGTRRTRIDPAFTQVANFAIGGPGKPFARSLHYIYEPTGNPFELKYGPNPMYPALSDTKLILRSEVSPLSFAEVMEILSRIFRKGFRSSVMAVEFTFDVSIPFEFFETHILTRAHSVRTVSDDRNRQTLYAGATRGRWMLRIYQKTSKTTRVEFVLRHGFLVDAGVTGVENLQKLKDLELNRLVRFPAICRRAFEDLIKGKFTGKRLESLRRWPGHWSSATLLEVLKDYDLESDAILRVSAEEQLLRKMQERFKW